MESPGSTKAHALQPADGPGPPLFHDTQLHQQARECVADQTERASPIRRSRVTDQPEPKRDASGGTAHVCSSGGGTRTHNLRINSLIQLVS